MDGGVKTFNDYHSSQRVEYPLSNEKVRIKLEFPSMGDISWSRLKGHCLKIDHCQIKYTPQVPANASGTVIFEVHDMRMERDKTLQAEYTVPIRCGVELNFFSSSFFSMKDDVPWQVFYSVENSDVLSGTRFCKIKARVKLSSAKHSTHINFRSPSINILSKGFSLRDVDFHHVSIPQVGRMLCRGNSVISGIPRQAIEPGESWASKSSLGEYEPYAIEKPYKDLEQLGLNSIDPGPSASEVGLKPNNEVLGLAHNKKDIILDPGELAHIVSDALLRGSEIGKNMKEEDPKKKGPA
ncbi:movement protein [Apiscitlodal virus]